MAINQIIKEKVNSLKKVDFLATLEDNNTPHITVLNSIRVQDNNTVLWGQICEGMSKDNVKLRPKIGFMVISQQKEIIRGFSVWRECRRTGPEYEMLNDNPDIHYNAYYSLTCVHYMDLKEISIIPAIKDEKISKSRQKTKDLMEITHKSDPEGPMNRITRELFFMDSSIKVLSFITTEGYPKIIPIPQSMSDKNGNVIGFTSDILKNEINDIPENSNVAVYGMSTVGTKYYVMVKGTFRKRQINGIETGIIEVERVYNPMLPRIGYIYPREPIKPVREFEGASDV